MTSTESHFSFTTKVNGDLLTVRGESVEEFTFNAEALADSLEAIAALQAAAQGIGRPQPAQAQPVQQAPVTPEQAVQNVQAAIPQAQVVQQAPTQIEVIQDKWGNTWTYNLPDAPDLPDGRGKYAQKQGVSKAGKPYKAFFDPAKGPKPFPAGATEAPPQWGAR